MDQQPLTPESLAEIIAPTLEAKGDRPIRSLTNPGDINKQVCAVLAQVVPPEVIAKTIDDMLAATRITKAGREPDFRAREAGAKLWLAYAVGMPIQRQEVVSVNLDADSAVGLRERLKSSPALRNALRGMLSEIED